MKKLVAGVFALFFTVLAGAGAQAADAAGIKAAMMTARENAVAMLGTTDAAALDKHQAAIAAATKSVDADLAAVLADKATAPEAAAKYKAFSETWTPFKATRDGELIPLIRAGKVAEAKALATGIQADRMKTMVGLLGELGAK